MNASVASVAKKAISLLLTAFPYICIADDFSNLVGIDVYGTEKIYGNIIYEKYQEELQQMLGALTDRNFELANEAENKIERSLKEIKDFGYLEMSVIFYPLPEESVYITIDVVENSDMARRMPFQTKEHFLNYSDPKGVFSEWREYQRLVSSYRGEEKGGVRSLSLLGSVFR